MGRLFLSITTRHTLLQVTIGNGQRGVPERCRVAGKHRTTLCQTRAKSAESAFGAHALVRSEEGDAP